MHWWVWCAHVGVVCTAGCGVYKWVWCAQVDVVFTGGYGVLFTCR